MERNDAGPSIVRYLADHCAFGVGVGVLILLALLAFDTAGIRTLVAASSDVFATTMILLVGSLITVMPMVLATAIGLLACSVRADAVPRRSDAADAAQGPSPVRAKMSPLHRRRQMLRGFDNRLGGAIRRTVAWGDRRIPRGVRSFVGVLFVIGGVFGFLPVVGFWMIPAGLALIALD